MRQVNRVIFTLILLLGALAVVGFVLENQHPLTLMLLGWRSPELPVSLVVVLALLLGMIIGPVVGAVLKARQRLKMARRHKLTGA